MKTKILLAFSLIILSISGSSRTWIITNSGFDFSPSSITISSGDSVRFQLDEMHNAVEVSEVTWTANGDTPLSGGFSVAFGGGLVLPDKLLTGTHYFVCAPHASQGMKGQIIVQNSTGIADNLLKEIISVYPNPSDGLMNIKTGKDWLGSAFYVTDFSGKQLIAGHLENETTILDIKNLAPGIYLLHPEGIKGRSVKLFKY